MAVQDLVLQGWTRRRLLRASALAGSGAFSLGALGSGVARATTEVEGGDEEQADGVEPVVRDPNADLSGQELNLYSSRHYDADQQIFDAFTAATGVKINVIEAEADQLIERIKAEGDNSPADVLITVDAGRLWRAKDEGLLRPFESDVLESAVPESLRDPEEHWFGFSRRVRVLAYAKDRVDPATLSTYEALADEAWRDKIVVRSSSNVYNQSLVGALIEANGLDATQEWAEGLVANFARSPEGGDIDQIAAVAAGEADVAIVNHYYWVRLLTSADAAEVDIANKTALFFPNQGEGQRGAHVNISGGGIVKTSPNPQAAAAFLEFMVSPEAQSLFALGNYELPVVAGGEVDAAVTALGEFTADPMSAAVFGANNQLALLLMLRAGWQ